LDQNWIEYSKTASDFDNIRSNPEWKPLIKSAKGDPSMRTVQITVELPDTVDSLDQLEGIIEAKGQRIKQQLFENEIEHLINHEKQNSDSVECPSCQKKVPSSKATSRAN